MMFKKNDTILFLLLMAILVPLELLCAALAYHTLGEITSGIYFFLVVGLNLVCVAVAFYSRLAGALLAVLLGLAIIPYQLLLGHRFIKLQHESARIVAYVYEHKLQTGDYPADLSRYEFEDPSLQAYIQTYRRDEERGGFALNYRVGTQNTSHSYSPRHGWGYYPD